jgi:hypothetical protein
MYCEAACSVDNLPASQFTTRDTLAERRNLGSQRQTHSTIRWYAHRLTCMMTSR